MPPASASRRAITVYACPSCELRLLGNAAPIATFGHDAWVWVGCARIVTNPSPWLIWAWTSCHQAVPMRADFPSRNDSVTMPARAGVTMLVVLAITQCDVGGETYGARPRRCSPYVDPTEGDSGMGP